MGCGVDAAEAARTPLALLGGAAACGDDDSVGEHRSVEVDATAGRGLEDHVGSLGKHERDRRRSLREPGLWTEYGRVISRGDSGRPSQESLARERLAQEATLG